MTKLASDEEFIRIWQTSNSPAEAAERSGFSPSYVCNKAKVLRDRGIAIKKMKPGPKTIRAERIAHLQKVLDEVNRELAEDGK